MQDAPAPHPQSRLPAGDTSMPPPHARPHFQHNDHDDSNATSMNNYY